MYPHARARVCVFMYACMCVCSQTTNEQESVKKSQERTRIEYSCIRDNTYI